MDLTIWGQGLTAPMVLADPGAELIEVLNPGTEICSWDSAPCSDNHSLHRPAQSDVRACQWKQSVN
jgi:hypothetical protein